MTRVGLGYDVHRLVPGRRLVLGGVPIDFDKGLLGHSDADVLLHAACDALLGAAALGDIGEHFPDTDPRFKDACSRDLLVTTYRRVEERGLRLVNLDATVFCPEAEIVSLQATNGLVHGRASESGSRPDQRQSHHHGRSGNNRPGSRNRRHVRGPFRIHNAVIRPTTAHMKLGNHGDYESTTH